MFSRTEDVLFASHTALVVLDDIFVKFEADQIVTNDPILR